MGGEHVLDLDGIDLLARDLDDELGAAGDEDVPIAVDATEIAGVVSSWSR